MTAEQKQGWRAETAAFVKRKADEGASSAVSVAKKAKTQDDGERKSAWDWTMQVQNTFEASLGYGMERWLRADRPFDEDMRPDEEVPGFLCGLFDQELLQWSGAFFCKTASTRSGRSARPGTPARGPPQQWARCFLEYWPQDLQFALGSRAELVSHLRFGGPEETGDHRSWRV